MYMTTVHRPDLPDIHLGFRFAHQAERACWSLQQDLTYSAHVPGTTITWGPTPDGVTPLEPVPAEVHAYAELLEQENHDGPPGLRFPDAFSRLKAQEGYDTAARVHAGACGYLDGLAEASSR